MGLHSQNSFSPFPFHGSERSGYSLVASCFLSPFSFLNKILLTLDDSVKKKKKKKIASPSSPCGDGEHKNLVSSSAVTRGDFCPFAL